MAKIEAKLCINIAGYMPPNVLPNGRMALEKFNISGYQSTSLLGVSD